MSDTYRNDTIILDLNSILLRLNISQNNSDDQGMNHALSNVLLKPERIVAVLLSIIGLFANLLSIVAISKVRGRLTSNLRYKSVHKISLYSNHDVCHVFLEWKIILHYSCKYKIVTLPLCNKKTTLFPYTSILDKCAYAISSLKRWDLF